jgi:hypothetical protein
MDTPQTGSGTLTPQNFRFAASEKSQELDIQTNCAYHHGVLLAGLAQGGYSLYLPDSFDFLVPMSYSSTLRVLTVLAWGGTA